MSYIQSNSESPEAAAASTTGADGGERISALVVSLFRTLAEAEVRALLWKDKPESVSALSGSGDIDLLVDRDRHDQAADVLRRLGFREVRASRWREQPFVTDWFAGDGSIGALIHIQLYEKLVLGSPFERQVEVPFPERLFGRLSTEFPPSPSRSDAAVIHLCRASLLNRWTERRKADRLLKEAGRLAAGCTEDELRAAAGMFSLPAAEAILRGFSGFPLAELRRLLLQRHRSRPAAGGESFRAKAWAAAARLNRRTLRLAVLPRRPVSLPAPVIAFIGSDGSGKSTAARRVAALLEPKMDVRFVYFGTGDGPISWYRAPLALLKRLREKRKARAVPGRAGEGDAGSESRRERVPDIARAAWAMTAALERRAKRRKITRATKAGWLVVTDRYPQTELPGIHDGPRLDDWTGMRGLRGMIARWERKIYRQIASEPPDTVILLDVPHETAMQRRPDEAPEELARRIEAASILRYPGSRRCVIRADEPIDAVVGAALTKIFSRPIHEH